MSLKTIEKIGKDEEKNHTCKLTSNLLRLVEDNYKTPYIHVSDMRLTLGMRRSAGCAWVLVTISRPVTLAL